MSSRSSLNVAHKFISHDAVCSLYPFSTFCAYRSIVWGVSSHTDIDAAEKYEEKEVGTLPARSLVMKWLIRLPELLSQTRKIGD